MNFKEYSQRFLKEQTPFGDLARDIKSDGGFPETKSMYEIESHLMKLGADREVIHIAQEMYIEFREEIS